MGSQPVERGRHADAAAADYSGCQDRRMPAARKPEPKPKAQPEPKPQRKRKPTPKPELPVLLCSTDADWERWLAEHHADAPGVWLQLAKKGCDTPTVSYAQALDTALCYGWIDGQVRRLDESFYLQRFTPRGPRSRWAQITRDHVARLTAAGRMRPSGQAQVDAAKADGRWDAAYEPQSRATVPDDLQRALDEHPAAAEFFATLRGSRRYAFLHRLHHVTDPARRAERIASYVELLSDGRTLN
jgi:uncharacterized protein YdeI (YjbR/CyaY-like superfamily)